MSMLVADFDFLLSPVARIEQNTILTIFAYYKFDDKLAIEFNSREVIVNFF